jgi:glutamine synthetase
LIRQPIALDTLDEKLEGIKGFAGRDLASYCENKLLPAMAELRKPIDALELLVSKEDWPVPSYGDLLFHTI